MKIIGITSSVLKCLIVMLVVLYSSNPFLVTRSIQVGSRISEISLVGEIQQVESCCSVDHNQCCCGEYDGTCSCDTSGALISIGEIAIIASCEKPAEYLNYSFSIYFYPTLHFFDLELFSEGNPRIPVKKIILQHPYLAVEPHPPNTVI